VSPKHAPPGSSSLADYRRKRAAGATPEPVGGAGVARPGLFVVQQHAARRLHYDLRLEFGGALRSWAVPKGPSLDPAEKRLAVLTEDHPLEYADFEGLIPRGNYGAGAMIVWDRGQWIPHLDPDEGMETGKQLFELRGYKLRGLWTLVKVKRDPKEWLLIKKPDEWATGEDAGELSGQSVLSGLTVEEMAEGSGRAGEIRAELERLGAPRRRVDPARLKPMLAETRRGAFGKPGWLFELKYDGYRVIAAKEPGEAGGGPRAGARLFFRSGREATATFPDLARALAAQPFESLVLDGEVVVLDEEARPSFQRLQRRAQLTRRSDVERAAIGLPATYYAFDLLAFEGFDLRPLPLLRRKECLARVLPAAGPLRSADHVAERGEELFAAVVERGLEGLMAKRDDAPYRAGRSAAWLKIRADRAGDFAVVGFTLPQGSRAGFGALHLAALRDGRLTYAGRVGSGFTDAQLQAIHAALAGRTRSDPPFAGEAPTGPEHVWVEPSLVVEVRYAEMTEADQLRLPVFLRLREDKTPADCPWPEPRGGDDEPVPEVVEKAAAAPRPQPRLSNLDKVFWPAEGYTKGDLVEHYRAVAPHLLPFLRDRPVVLDRYPDGIGGKSFFQKNAPPFLPDWVRTEAIWAEGGDDGGGKETRFVICDDVETLVLLANLGAIPLHVWASRAGSLQAPDWAILDLDAKDAPFPSVVSIARALERLCGEVGLPAFAKTSGATGLHVLLPTGGLLTHEQARQLAEVLARLVVTEHPDLASIARTPASRQGLVYVDYLQNGYGKLLVAPYSVRPLPGAPVSTPLTWREVNGRLDPAAFTIRTLPRRLARRKSDPLAALLTAHPDLYGALERLAARL
jgi:bifunctional non-homologous end joining protein LigD